MMRWRNKQNKRLRQWTHRLVPGWSDLIGFPLLSLTLFAAHGYSELCSKDYPALPPSALCRFS